MTSQLEERIARTLEGAEVGAPVPDAAFFQGVRARTRRRRTQRRAGVAAVLAAVAVIVGAVAATPRSRLDNAPVPPTQIQPGPRRETQPPLADAQPVEKVWPQAFHKLPMRLPDDREYTVIGSLDEHHFIVQADPPQNVEDPAYGPPLVLDAGTDVFTPLASSSAPAGFPTQGMLAVVGDTDVLWAVKSPSGASRAWYEIWAIPRGGGAPHKVVRREGTEYLVAMRAFGGVAYLELNGDNDPYGPGTGLASVPITGGTVTPIPHSEGFHLTGGGFAFQEQPRVTETFAGGAIGVTMLDLGTGDRIAYFFAGDLENVWCSPSWCRGNDMGTNKLVAVRLGGDEVALETQGKYVDGGVRFVWGMSDALPFQTMYLWDVETGKVGTASDLASYADGGPDGFRTPDVLTWRSADGYLGAVDLSRIS